jgi:Ca2+-transporting ATPase
MWDVLDEVRSGEGQTQAEAQKRRAENGPNKLDDPPKTSLLKRFLSQLIDPMILILIVAAVVSGVTAFYAGESFADVFIILVVVIVNAVLGVYQESKAEKAIEALQKMTAATSKVLRGGRIEHVKSSDVVLGDVVVLEAGRRRARRRAHHRSGVPCRSRRPR